jgi:enoyl-CoA hydratase/carnithine racemase
MELPWYVDCAPVRRWLAAMQEKGELASAEERVAGWKRMVDEHEIVRTWKDGHLFWVELTHPEKANSFVPPMYGLLRGAIRDAGADDDVRAVIFRGAGKVFSGGGYVGHDGFFAGLDSGEDGTNPEPSRQTFAHMFQPIQHDLHACEKPTIGMLNGPVVSEALDFALACDIRTAATEATLHFGWGSTGNTAYTGAAWMLPRLVGLSKAKELLLTASPMTAEEAERCGLVARVAPREELEAVTVELAQRVASLPPISIRLIKKEIDRMQEVASYPAALDLLSMIETIVQATEDHMDAERAFLEKRPPVVRGR